MKHRLAALAILLCLAGCGDTPASNAINDVQVIAGLKAEGMPIGEMQTYTAETDPNKHMGRPNGYTSKTNFLDTRLEREVLDEFATGDGGSVEVYADEAGAKARMKYLQDTAKALPLLIEYNYVKGGVLLRLSKRLTPDQAAEYEKALDKAVK